MARGVIGVREAHVDDLPALVDLWSQLRAQGLRPFGRAKVAESADAVAGRFRAAIGDPAYRLVVACSAAEIIGMALLRLAGDNPLNQVPAVEVSHVCVSDRHRRRGAGKALMAAALLYAEEHACDNVLVSVLPQQRDAQRFYARLGFVPVSVRRVAPVAALRRHLAPADGRAAALRRELRSRTPARRTP